VANKSFDSLSPFVKLKSILNFAFSALQSMKILFSCEDFTEKSFFCH